MKYTLTRLAQAGEIWQGVAIESNVGKRLWWARPEPAPEVLICTDGLALVGLSIGDVVEPPSTPAKTGGDVE